MALELWWGSGSPFSWRALLALEYRGSPTSRTWCIRQAGAQVALLLKMNPRGRVPVLKDGDYVCFESLAILTTWTGNIRNVRCSAALPRRRA